MTFDSQAYRRAWDAHDADAVVALMTDDAVYEDVALGERHEGREDVRGFVERVATEFSSDYAFEWGSEVVGDAGFAAEWVMVGTHDRSSPTMPATQKPYRIRGVSFGTLRGDRIATNRDYWNAADFLQQIGLMPQPEAAGAG